MQDPAGHPDGTRIIVRRERPHPGAQLSLFDLHADMRHQAFLTDTPDGTDQSLSAHGPEEPWSTRQLSHPQAGQGG